MVLNVANPHTHARMHARTLARSHARTCTCMQPCTHIRMYAHTHAHLHKRTRTHARACTQCHTHEVTRCFGDEGVNMRIKRETSIFLHTFWPSSPKPDHVVRSSSNLSFHVIPKQCSLYCSNSLPPTCVHFLNLVAVCGYPISGSDINKLENVHKYFTKKSSLLISILPPRP